MENNLSWENFEKVELRVGTILSAIPFKEAKKPAYILSVDFGEFGIKKSSAQLTVLYSCDELVGKQVIAVTNFPKKQIATIQSECLVVGTLGENKAVTLLTTDKPVENGLRIG